MPFPLGLAIHFPVGSGYPFPHVCHAAYAPDDCAALVAVDHHDVRDVRESPPSSWPSSRPGPVPEMSLHSVYSAHSFRAASGKRSHTVTSTTFTAAHPEVSATGSDSRTYATSPTADVYHIVQSNRSGNDPRATHLPDYTTCVETRDFFDVKKRMYLGSGLNDYEDGSIRFMQKCKFVAEGQYRLARTATERHMDEEFLNAAETEILILREQAVQFRADIAEIKRRAVAAETEEILSFARASGALETIEMSDVVHLRKSEYAVEEVRRSQHCKIPELTTRSTHIERSRVVDHTERHQPAEVFNIKSTANCTGARSSELNLDSCRGDESPTGCQEDILHENTAQLLKKKCENVVKRAERKHDLRSHDECIDAEYIRSPAERRGTLLVGSIERPRDEREYCTRRVTLENEHPSMSGVTPHTSTRTQANLNLKLVELDFTSGLQAESPVPRITKDLAPMHNTQLLMSRSLSESNPALDCWLKRRMEAIPAKAAVSPQSPGDDGISHQKDMNESRPNGEPSPTSSADRSDPTIITAAYSANVEIPTASTTLVDGIDKSNQLSRRRSETSHQFNHIGDPTESLELLCPSPVAQRRFPDIPRPAPDGRAKSAE
ncbi:hypothetical protein C8F01DRAFT_1081511 [Mycena amicta]|nr:hypothetical protein C8F01DRAFT_1081511 [Mycena amicta]